MKCNKYGFVHYSINNCSILLEPGIIALPIASLYRITSLCFRNIHFWWNQSIIKIFRQNQIDMKWNEYGFVHEYINNCSILFKPGIIALPIEILYRIASVCFHNIHFWWNQSIIKIFWQNPDFSGVKRIWFCPLIHQ
jgi:hypothetical protein